MSRPGDWNCRSCQHLNFQRRESCQRCGELRGGERGGDSSYGGFGGRSGSPFGLTGPDVRPGDWYCSVDGCGTHNFAVRSTCFRCGAPKDESDSGGRRYESETPRPRGFGASGGSGGSSSRRGWRPGDWICTRSGCNEHNFAMRSNCFRCNAPREYSSGGGSDYSS
ncbi:transcription initiation factor TFIID subunit 15-like [Rhodamnia argentea]|uniref:Transcription initiation factor TFIID subunit 15-like n=1 Tax=Rhodamnia argentea TaxID=178133 RepID=A0A8B8QME8_9MYRT|nr:transcription initiation factor TFIID subunit 15-like [Rhodamnia argentea]XP_030548352.1 transcription initiation factor TFIID subunit 15-like [Rhodamnia argentea]